MFISPFSVVTAMPLVNGHDNGSYIPKLVWKPIVGLWNTDELPIAYQGPEAPGATTPYGIARSSRTFREGRIAAVLTLPRSESLSAGFVFGFQSISEHYILVQLGAFDRAYSVAEFRPQSGWELIEGVSHVRNLKAGNPYALAVSLEGQRIRMLVDQVVVLETVLPQPLAVAGLGLFAYGDGCITFDDIAVDAKPPNAFVVMPFREPYDTLYKDVIYREAKRAGFEVIRADEIYGPGLILDDIRRQIEQAHVVIAEISTHNPNVYYELGYAHALAKPALLLARKKESEDVPFDIQPYRAIHYDDSIGGKRKLQSALRAHLKAIQSGF